MVRIFAIRDEIKDFSIFFESESQTIIFRHFEFCQAENSMSEQTTFE